MLTDTHCHLASHRFSTGEVPDLIHRAQEAGVTRLVTLATSLEDLEPNLRIAENPAVHACIGIHPCDVHNAPDNFAEILSQHASDPRVCAIGETGLDYYHPAPDGWTEENFRARQRYFLHQHFRLAAESKLNIVIHTRDKEGHASLDDALAIYNKHRGDVRAVFHCYIGSAENLRRILDLGGIVSFGGVATFKSSRDLRDTIAACPQGAFMLETDSPYLAPEPHRGKRNEPAFTKHTAELIASTRGESLDELAKHTEATADAFFRMRR